MSPVFIAGIATTVFGRHLDRPVHYATAVGEIIQVENLGFIPRGEGGPAEERGESGARQVPGARHAIKENDGGFQGVEEASLGIHILSR